MEFAYFFDPVIHNNKESIIKEFIGSKDWPWYTWVHNVSQTEYEITVSDNLRKVEITTFKNNKKMKKEEKSNTNEIEFTDGKWRKCLLEIYANDHLVYSDSLLAKTKPEMSVANKTMSNKPERKALVKSFKGKPDKIIYKFKTEKVDPE